MLEKEPTPSNIQLLEPGTLLEKAITQTHQALNCGALQPIPTHSELIEQAGIRFLVRVLANLVKKDEAAQKVKTAPTGKPFNPFLPYDENLFVADLTQTHLCLLNKFNVVDQHLLIVTRAFEEQETLLNLQDFEALWITLTEIDGLGFYNSGKAAGASQPHKHLQLVPLPLTPDRPIPIAAQVELALQAEAFNGVNTAPDLPFVHAVASLPLDLAQPPSEAAPILLTTYQTLLETVGLQPQPQSGNYPNGAYNLLVTRQWMFIVPRTQEQFEAIPVNALGFAGTLFVRNEAQLESLKQQHPLTVLQGVAIPR